MFCNLNISYNKIYMLISSINYNDIK